MSMLGFVYLVLILGWVLIVICVKCKKSMKSNLAFTENYTDTLANDRRPTVHVIDLPSEDIENEEFLESYERRRDSLRRQSYRSNRSSILNERTVETYPADAVINPAFLNDDDYIINAPPPSYEEVMSQPEVYPKVHHVCKSSEANI